MSVELLEKLTDELAAAVVAKAGPKLLAYLDARRAEKQPDPLLTVREIAQRLSLGETTVRQLVELGELQRAKGMTDIRVRQSVVDAYGTKEGK